MPEGEDAVELNGIRFDEGGQLAPQIGGQRIGPPVRRLIGIGRAQGAMRSMTG